MKTIVYVAVMLATLTGFCYADPSSGRIPDTDTGYRIRILGSDGKFYQKNEGTKTWTSAKRSCVARGGRLPVIYNSATNDAVRALTNDNAKSWIDGTDNQNEGEWRTSDGVSLTFTNWDVGEPNNDAGSTDNEDCALQYGSGKWNDQSCEDQISFLCQFDSDIDLKTFNAETKDVASGCSYGSWGLTEMCPRGTFVTSVNIQTEEYQGSGVGGGHDDTALNVIEFYCGGSYITSKKGGWGSWRGVKTCPSGSYVTGVNLKYECNGGDDVGATNLEVQCGSHNLGPWSLGSANWGRWGGFTRCSSGYAVCGLRTRVESDQRGGDDTALNDLEITCCKL